VYTALRTVFALKGWGAKAHHASVLFYPKLASCP